MVVNNESGYIKKNDEEEEDAYKASVNKVRIWSMTRVVSFTSFAPTNPSHLHVREAFDSHFLYTFPFFLSLTTKRQKIQVANLYIYIKSNNRVRSRGWRSIHKCACVCVNKKHISIHIYPRRLNRSILQPSSIGSRPSRLSLLTRVYIPLVNANHQGGNYTVLFLFWEKKKSTTV